MVFNVDIYNRELLVFNVDIYNRELWYLTLIYITGSYGI
jgi:hypothetical protein